MSKKVSMVKDESLIARSLCVADQNTLIAEAFIVIIKLVHSEVLSSSFYLIF